MKIDLSTIFLVIFLVLPGLFSRRSQNSISPRSLETQGATEELAEFVVQGVAVHLILAFFISIFGMLWGLSCHQELTYFFSILDQANPEVWAKLHPTETTMLFGSYVVLTFIVGYLFGLLCGVWRLNHPVTSFLLKKANWLQRLGVTGSLGERPIIYQVLSPAISPQGVPSIVFVEVEMKGNLGFYSGQVRQYAVVKDGEPHKLIYLIEVWFKLARSDEYVTVEAEGIMIDLADVATMKVDQVSAASLVPDEASPDLNAVPEDPDGGAPI